MRNFKRTLALCLALVMVLLTAACQSNTTSGSNSGVFTGESKGKNGPIKVEVKIENAEIKDIKIVENHESDFTKNIFEQLPKSMIAANTADVDVISGATLTSNAIIEAVKDAIKKSGITLAAKNASQDGNKVEDTSTDIVIIGSGGAGLTAAIEAATAGAKVIVVEKNSFMGGNTNYATGGMNAAGTKYQEAKGVKDSPELFYKDTMKGGHDLNDPALLKVLTEKSADAIYWLESLGANLSNISRSGGASADRMHTAPEGAAIGSYLMGVFEENVKKLGIDVRLNTKAVEILSEGNKATGIVVETSEGQKYTVNAKAVIIASGGFGANQDMVVEYKPELKGFGTTNQPGATGDAFGMIEKLNVALVDMEQIQTHPTVVPVKNEMITEGVRGEGAILVNLDGKRFINELETRDVVSKAILSQKDGKAFLVFDTGVVERLAAINKYKKQGLLTEAASIKELAEKIGVNAAELEKTISTYNGYTKSQDDKEFGRRVLADELVKGPFYAVEVGPAIHHTMGGIKINTNAQVLNNSGNIIEGLFAAGEVTGGVHGGNRIGGNAVADITIFGRIAGQNAASYVK
ncbi:MAG: flavocytochrome c [Clostridia bacterium]|jgi:fumarate reductase flavoprotein subunit|nr:flavocytochrome c [Clostridia bacterium]